MNKNSIVYIYHILEAIDLIADFVDDKNIISFMDDKMCYYAVAHQIQIMGEAANQIDMSIRSKYEEIPWQDIIDTRHKIVHDYMDIDLEILWDITQKDLPLLRDQLQVLVDTEK